MDWTKSEEREFHKNALRMKKEYLKLFMHEWGTYIEQIHSHGRVSTVASDVPPSLVLFLMCVLLPSLSFILSLQYSSLWFLCWVDIAVK